KKEWNESVAKLQTAKDKSPTAIDNSNLGWAYYNKGSAEKEAKNKEQADKDFAMAKASSETAVQQDPKLDAAYVNLGSSHNALGEFQAAVNVLNVVLGFRPGWSIATNQLGVGFRGLGDLVNAVAAFKRVVDGDGNNVYGLFSLGEAYNASGNKKEAKKINDRLKKINPALASKLDAIFSGKAIVDKVVPKVNVPRFPRFP
ncbi:MAG TPA: tetratricopeptide repeat protein, partial [Pyrinomonadaceae bacterium]|nr:tetratricopeptide repeat protein [Pyrinomonadaceae bacterium]